MGKAVAMDQPPFKLERAADGSAVLTTVPEGSSEPARLRLDDDALRALRDGIDAAVARGASGGEGAVAEFAADGAVVTVIAVPGGSVRLRVER
jgi:hypothetical protein